MYEIARKVCPQNICCLVCQYQIYAAPHWDYGQLGQWGTRGMFIGIVDLPFNQSLDRPSQMDGSGVFGTNRTKRTWLFI